MKELRVFLETKDAEISYLKVKIYQFSSGSSDELKDKNAELKAQVAALTGKVKRLIDEVKYLTK